VPLEALEALLARLDPAALEALSPEGPDKWWAVRGQGRAAVGDQAVSSPSVQGLLAGLVYDVLEEGPAGTCSLRQACSGVVLRDGDGRPSEFPLAELAVAGPPLRVTPLHASVLAGCPPAVVAALAARAPVAAFAVQDSLGRMPLALAVEVMRPLASLRSPHPPTAIGPARPRLR